MTTLQIARWTIEKYGADAEYMASETHEVYESLGISNQRWEQIEQEVIDTIRDIRKAD